MEHRGVFEAFCREVTFAPFEHPKWPKFFPDRLLNLLPSSIRHWRLPHIAEAIRRQNSRRYDLVHVCDIVLAQYFLDEHKDIPLSIDRSRVDLQFQIQQAAFNTNNIKDKFLAGEHLAKMWLFERKIARRSQLQVLCGPDDEVFVRQRISTEVPVQVIANGVDLDFFKADINPEPLAAQPTVLFCGAMDYTPNVDDLRWSRVKAASERARAAESAEKAERRRAEDAEAAAYRERTLRKRMRVFGICAAALAVLCLIVTSIAWNQRTKILEARAKELSANLERIQAENATLTALASASKALKAVEAAKENASDMAKIRDLIVAANSEYQTARQQSDTSICPAGRRVYAHVCGAAEANWLERPLQALKGAGFIVPDTEIMAAQKLPSRTELRYFRRNEESGALAALAVLSQAGLDGVVARYVPGYEDSQRIRLCHYELWMATRQ